MVILSCSVVIFLGKYFTQKSISYSPIFEKPFPEKGGYGKAGGPALSAGPPAAGLYLFLKISPSFITKVTF